ncbi:MAG: ABC transporter ATP-binding protein [Candidatus Eisenbacteria bacterium]
MSLLADVRLDAGTFRLEARFSAARGETVALLGPNGAGKSTLVRALAGLLPLDGGEVVLEGRVLERPDSGIRIPPAGRSAGVVFQDLRLFPHLSARDNAAYGLRARRVPAREARRLGEEWLERLGVAHRASAYPASLSGGEAQRVALARALAARPRMLLLDEPLSSLDVRVKASVGRVLRRELSSFDGVKLLVTHDPVEALALADRLVVLEEGRLAQEGTPAEVRRRPRSLYVASFVGLNLISGSLAREAGHDVVRAGAVRIHAPRSEEPEGAEVIATVHPRAIAISLVRPSGSPRNVLRGRIESIDVAGDSVRVLVGTDPGLTAEITTDALSELRLSEGQDSWISFKAAEVNVYAR